MSIQRDTVQIDYLINGKMAINEFGKLQAEMGELTKESKDLQKSFDLFSKNLKGMSKDNVNFTFLTNQVAKYKQRLEENAQAIRRNVEAQTTLRNTMKLSEMTNDQLRSEYNATSRVLNQLTKDTQEYATAEKRLIAIQKERQTRKVQFNEPEKPGGILEQIKSQMPSMLVGGAAGLAAGGVTMAIDFAKQFFDTLWQKWQEGFARLREKSKAITGLAAITGLDPKKDAADLKFYGDAAEYMAKKFNMAVPDVVDAMAKIGSLKPELLKMKEQLVELTNDAITLARADGKLSVEEAAESLAGSLNQFNQGAEQSTRFMNVLAASAAAGSAEINQVAESFKVAGAVLAASNISFEQANALVQALAKKQIVGSEAGTALRNVFSKLLIQTRELNPTMVGLEKALENLSKLTPQKMVKLFGQENLVAAMTLVQFRKEVKALGDEMTGTSSAVQQAATRMDNLDEDVKSLGKSWDGLFDLGPDQEGGFRKTTQWLSVILTAVGKIKKLWPFSPTDLAGPGAWMIKAILSGEKMVEQTKKEVILDRRKAAQKQGAQDYNQGLTEENLSRYEGKDTFEQEKAYAREFINQAREQYKKLDAQIKYIERAKLDGKGYDLNKMKEELFRMGGRIVAGRNAFADAENRRIANEKMIADLERGEEEEKKKKKDKDADKQKKHLEELAREEIERENKIAEERTRMLADEEEREIQQRQLRYARELQDLSKQEGDKAALYKALEEGLQHDIAEIRKKYAEKQQQETIETALRLAKAVREVQVQVAQKQLRDAELQPNNEKGVFDARYNLSLVTEQQTLDELDAAHAKEILKYKDNAAALENIEKAHQQQRLLIQRAGQAERLAALKEYHDAKKARESAASIESAELDVREAEMSGSTSAVLKKKLTLLDLQMAHELDVANLTEQEKTNILRRYQLQRDQLVKDSADLQAQTILDSFQQGLSVLGQFSAVSITNEETRANDAKARNDKRLQDQLNAGIISQEQYNAQREQLDSRYEEKQRQMRIRRAEAEKKEALFSAGITMALNILKAGINPFAIAMATAMGLAQIALISSREIPQYFEGGFPGMTGGAPKGSGPRIISVNEKGQEWISPAWQLQDPATKPVLDWLEWRRSNNVIGFQGPAVPGAGNDRQARSSQPGGAPPIIYQDPVLTAAIQQLNHRLERGISAYISQDQLQEQQDLMSGIYEDSMIKK